MYSLNQNTALLCAAAATEVFTTPLQLQHKKKVRFKLKDNVTGAYLAYNGETHWASKYTAKNKLIISILGNHIAKNSGLILYYEAVKQFVEQEIKRGRFVLEEISA